MRGVLRRAIGNLLGIHYGRPHTKIPTLPDYLILYHVLNDTIEILHVIHGARDYQRLLGPEDEPPA